MVSLEQSTDGTLDGSIVAEIQRKIGKRRDRWPISKPFHAKNDKEAIATWRSDLNGILLTFNVCSVLSVWLLLTARSQTELAVNTHLVASDIRHELSEFRGEIGGQVRSVSGSQSIYGGMMLTVLRHGQGQEPWS